MKRQNIILGQYTYLADYYKADIDKEYMPVYKKFVMLRNSNIMNDVVYDTEVYFVEEELVQECENTDGSIDIEKLSSSIVYPINNSSISGYSSNYKDFNYNFNSDSFIFGNDIQRLYNNRYECEPIKCDMIRVYLPTTNPTLQSVICVKSYINNIQFYFLCRETNKYEINSETEFTVGNVSYSEYFDVYIPSISTLFAHNSVYSVENYNLNEIKQDLHYTISDNKFVNMFISLIPEITNINNDFVIENKLNFDISAYDVDDVCFRLYSDVDNYDETFKTTHKTFIVNKDLLNDNGLTVNDVKNSLYVANPDVCLSINENISRHIATLTVSAIYNADLQDYEINTGEYSEYFYEDTTNYILINYNASSLINVSDFTELNVEAFNKTNEINISWSKFSDKINIVELQTLTLPFSIMPVSHIDGISNMKVYYNTNENVESNYESANIVISLYPYKSVSSITNYYELPDDMMGNSDVFTGDINFDIHAGFNFSTSTNNKGKLVVKSVFKYPNQSKFNNVWESYCYYNNVSINDYKNFKLHDDIDNDFYNETNIDLIGYRIEIASDKNHSHIIYSLDRNIDMNTDAEYFIDDFEFVLDDIFDTWDNKPSVLSIRTFFIDKMCANIIDSNNILLSKDQYKYLINYSSENRVISLPDMQADPTLQKNTNTDYMDLTKFNFIDKITCTVNKNETITAVGSTNNVPKILYKPIFYKVADLQTIKIRKGLKQNIGINLADLMTKVETFKLIIDDITYIESARNDVYVIFNINASNLTNTTGTYSITNQDDEYISSGYWGVY